MNTSDIIIRAATSADAALLAELGAQTFYETFAAENTPENMTAYLASAFGPEIQAAELADPASRFFIAECGGVVIGYARLYAGEPPACIGDPEAAELQRIYVIQEWLKRGVGALLLQTCLREARAAGHQTIWLGVWERNPRAIAFYQRWEFEPVGTHVFQLGTEAQTDLLLRRRL